MKEAQLQSLGKDLAATFPNVPGLAPVRLLGEGWGSIAVESSTGLVLRISKHQLTQRQNERLMKILPLIQGGLGSLQIPAPEFFVKSSEQFPFGVMAYRKIEGTIPTKEQVLANSTRFAAAVASLLRAFHSIELTDELRDLDYPGGSDSVAELETIWAQASEYLAGKLPTREHHSIQEQWQQIVQFIGSQPWETALIHGDPWYQNLIVDEQMHIVGIVDFEKVGLGDPAIDLALQQYASVEFMDQVIGEYQKAGGPLGDQLDRRLEAWMQAKCLKDLVYGFEIGHIHPRTVPAIRTAFGLALR